MPKQNHNDDATTAVAATTAAAADNDVDPLNNSVIHYSESHHDKKIQKQGHTTSMKTISSEKLLNKELDNVDVSDNNNNDNKNNVKNNGVNDNDDVNDDEDNGSSSNNTSNNTSKNDNSSGGMIRGMIRSWTSRFAIGRLPAQAASSASKTVSSSSGKVTSSIMKHSISKAATTTVTKSAAQSAAKVAVTTTTKSSASAASAVGKVMKKLPNQTKNTFRIKRGGGVRSSQNINKFLDKKQVAKVSDRISTGLDWYQTAVDTTTSITTSSSSSEKTTTSNLSFRKLVSSISIYSTKIMILSGTIIKNTILGGIVFESYGSIITSMSQQKSLFVVSSSPPSSTMSSIISPPITPPTIIRNEMTMPSDEEMDGNNKEQEEVVIVNDDYMKVTVFGHLIAGMISGTIHGILSQFFDISHNIYQRIKQGQSNNMATFSSSSKQLLLLLSSSNVFSLYAIFYHSISHSILFGSYEYWKRKFLPFTFIPSNYSNHPSPPNNDSSRIIATSSTSNSSSLDNNNDNNNNIEENDKNDIHDIEHDNHSHGNTKIFDTYNSFIAIGIAGGIAGQMQHIVSHYMEPQERLSVLSSSVQQTKNNSHHSLLESLKRIHRRRTYAIIHPKEMNENSYNFKVINNKNMTCFLSSYLQRRCSRKWKIFSTILSSSSSSSSPPTLRSILYAFPPSAIGFIAFEYGKHAI